MTTSKPDNKLPPERCEIPSHSSFNDLTGMTFDRWKVLYYIGRFTRRTKYWCQCQCGTLKAVHGSSLSRDLTKSCGCYSSEVTADRSSKFSDGVTKLEGYRREVFETWCHQAETQDTPCIELPDSFSKSSRRPTVSLSGKPMTLARAILLTEAGSPPKGRDHAAHNCGNEACVNIAHLEWKSAKENHADKLRHRTLARGSGHYNSKLTEAQVIEIFALKGSGRKPKDIAPEYGVSPQPIKSIWSGRSWAWLTGMEAEKSGEPNV